MTPDRYIIFDTETYGLESTRQACDIGLIEIDPVTLEETGRVESLIKLDKPIPPEATAIHGITDDMLKDAPTIDEFVNDVLGGRLEGKVALIGHRIDFDLPMFAPIGDVARFDNGDPCTVDTLLLWQLFGNVETKDRKLDTLKEALHLPGGGQSHRALADCITAHQLLQYIVPLTDRSLESLALTERFVLHEMPWGKYEGTLLMKVPRQYRYNFLMKLDNLDRHLKYSLELVARADFPLPVPGAPRAIPVKKKRTLTYPPRRKA